MARGFRARDGHSSGTAVAGRLEQPTQATIRRRIQGFLSRETPCVAPIRFCSRWGLPCRSCCHARGALLPHRFTLASRRFVFCGAFPGVAPAGSYPAPCLRGARTFLRCESGGHPAGWHRTPDSGRIRNQKSQGSSTQADIAPDFTQIEHVPENLLGDLTDQMNRFDRHAGAIQPSLPAACASKV